MSKYLLNFQCQLEFLFFSLQSLKQKLYLLLHHFYLTALIAHLACKHLSSSFPVPYSRQCSENRIKAAPKEKTRREDRKQVNEKEIPLTDSCLENTVYFFTRSQYFVSFFFFFFLPALFFSFFMPPPHQACFSSFFSKRESLQ